MKIPYVFTFLISFNILTADVASLEDMQAKQPTLRYHYTFEGTTSTSQLEQKAGSQEPLLEQVGFDNRYASFEQGLDPSTTAASFKGWASGAKGESLKSSSELDYTNSGSTEYLVQLDGAQPKAAMNFMVGGYGGMGDDRWYFLGVYETGARMTIGANKPLELIGEGSPVAYHEDAWYYVVQSWSIADGKVTINAWVTDLSAVSPKAVKVIDNAVNRFTGSTETKIYLANLGNNTAFASGRLDSLAIYDEPIEADTIQKHLDAIVE